MYISTQQVLQTEAGLKARQQAGTDLEHKRRSLGLPVRHPMDAATAPLPKSALFGRASIGQPTDALQYLANKGTRIQDLETELTTAQDENLALNQQNEQLDGILHTHKNELAILQKERDFLASQRDQERQDMERQLSQSEQRILTVSQNLRRSEQAKVYHKPLSPQPPRMNVQGCEQVTVLTCHHRQLQRKMLRLQGMSLPKKRLKLQTWFCITSSNYSSFSKIWILHSTASSKLNSNRKQLQESSIAKQTQPASRLHV